MQRRGFFLASAIMAVGMVACHREPSLNHGYASADELGRAILKALAAGDRAQLEALALTQQEFEASVWPELPAARPERNLPLSYVWGDLHQKSQASLASILKQRSGQRMDLDRVNFAGVTPYRTYRVHRQATLEVRDVAGARLNVRVCGSMIEKDGAWKVFSYVVDD